MNGVGDPGGYSDSHMYADYGYGGNMMGGSSAMYMGGMAMDNRGMGFMGNSFQMQPGQQHQMHQMQQQYYESHGEHVGDEEEAVEEDEENEEDSLKGMSEETREKMKNRGHVYEYKGKRLEIRDVWKDNLEEEMKVIRSVITKCKYVAMDTEFPGVVARPVGPFNNSVDFQYQTLRCNVDLLKLIQLGIALADEDGNFADGCPCWQFHFKFSLTDDMYAQDSIDLLVRSGIDFELHDKMGIDVEDFGEALMSSGLVLMDDVKWISFHGGYDFGYLLKLLTFTPLPAEEKDFFKLLHTYFPCVYDVKHIMTKLEGATFKAGLNKLAEELGAERVGPMHQAGSDSLLTASVFFALRKRYFNDNFTDHGHAGILHGLGDGDPNRMNLS